MEVRKIDFPTVVHVVAHLRKLKVKVVLGEGTFQLGKYFYKKIFHFDLHVGRWFDKAERGVVRMSVQQPEGDWDVVVLTLEHSAGDSRGI